MKKRWVAGIFFLVVIWVKIVWAICEVWEPKLEVARVKYVWGEFYYDPNGITYTDHEYFKTHISTYVVMGLITNLKDYK